MSFSLGNHCELYLPFPKLILSGNMIVYLIEVRAFRELGNKINNKDKVEEEKPVIMKTRLFYYFSSFRFYKNGE